MQAKLIYNVRSQDTVYARWRRGTGRGHKKTFGV